MVALALLTASAYVAFFLVRWNTPLLHRLALSSVGVLDGMLSDGDDDEKLAALEAGTGKLLRALFAFLALLAASVLLLVAPTHVLNGNLELLETWQGIAALSVGGTLALVLPRRMPNSPDASGLGASSHSALDQLLHRMLLNHPHVHLRLMWREIQGWRKGGGAPRPTFLWVTGLARAGTTSVLERLVATGAFHSLNYANMPLVLAPGLWKRFHNPGTGELQERSHGDGILVGLDSAEALEEVFFQAMTGRSYVSNTALEAHDVSPGLHNTYLDYQGIALASSDRPDAMYVAKNNNALLRYPAMRRQNRDFHVVFMFREPLTHAASLLAMHRKYCAMQTDDSFVKEYMDWLAHREFGLGHLPFRFPSTAKLPEGDCESLDYWLEVWINHHREALDLDPHRLHFVQYETYCAHPNAVLQSLMREVGAKGKAPSYPSYRNTRPAEGDVNPAHLAEARKLYDAMCAQAHTPSS